MVDKKTVVIALIIVLAFIFSALLNVRRAETKETNLPLKPFIPVEIEEQPRQDFIYVQLEGAIKNPGIYKMHEGARLFQVIHLAGGLSDEADGKRVNQTLKLNDEDFIVIARKGEDTVNIEPAPGSTTLISLSNADESELITLPNIGPASARNIIAYREEYGDFQTTAAVMNVSGIGEATFDAIKDLIEP